MATSPKTAKGWKPIPLALKMLFVVLILWSLGAVANLQNLMANGVPFFGFHAQGFAVVLIFLVFDIVGPLGFLYGLWNRRPWAPRWAFAYMGVFILNGIVALLVFRGELGGPQILLPIVATAIFLGIIHWKRGYFAGR